MTVEQFDLFTDVEAADAWRDRVQRMRDELALDCCSGEPVTDDRGRTLVRCGRCGDRVASFDLLINHDSGWCGCPPDLDPAKRDGRARCAQHDDDPSSWLADRHDRAHFPDCVGCGEPWGLHRVSTVGFAMPAYVPSLARSGCKGYVAPDGAATRGGWCPGCWSEPHDGDCPPIPESAPGGGHGRFVGRPS